MRIPLLAVISMGILIGCGVAPLNRNVITNTPSVLATKSRTVAVSRVVDTVGVGKIVGKAYTGLPCISAGNLYWRGSEKMINNIADLAMLRLEKYGFSLVGKAYSPFNNEVVKQSELLLGGKLVEVNENACFSINGVKGVAYVKIEWQIYENTTGKVLLTLNTEGYSSEDRFNRVGDNELFERAYNMAIDNLLAEKAFFALLTNQS